MFKLHLQESGNSENGHEETGAGIRQDILNWSTEDFDGIDFSETLTVRSGKTGEVVGSYEVHVEKDEDEEGQIYFSVQVHNETVIDEATSVVKINARIRPDGLQTISQEQTESMQFGDFHYEKYTKLIQEAENYRVIQRISRPEAVAMVKDRSLPFDQIENFIGEGANIILIRLLMKRPLDSEIELTTLDGDTDLCQHPISEVRGQQENQTSIVGIGRTIKSSKGSPDQWIYLNLADTRLFACMRAGSTAFATINDGLNGESVSADLYHKHIAPIDLAPFGFLSNASIMDVLSSLQSLDGNDERFALWKAYSNDYENRNDSALAEDDIPQEAESGVEKADNQEDTELLKRQKTPEPSEELEKLTANGETVSPLDLGDMGIDRPPSECSLPPIDNRPLSQSARSGGDAQKLLSRLNSILDAFSDDNIEEQQPFSARLNPEVYDEDAEDVEEHNGSEVEDSAIAADSCVVGTDKILSIDDKNSNALGADTVLDMVLVNKTVPITDQALQMGIADSNENTDSTVSNAGSRPHTANSDFDTELSLKLDCQKYLGAHPELRGLLCQFVQAVLIAKPDDITWFGATYFKIISDAKKTQQTWQKRGYDGNDSAIE